MSNNIFTQQNPQITPNRAANLIAIQKNISNMSVPEYMNFMQKLRAHAQAQAQRIHHQNAVSQSQIPYHPTNLLLPPNAAQQPFNQGSFPSSAFGSHEAQQSSLALSHIPTSDINRSPQPSVNTPLTTEQIQAATQYIEALRNGQTPLSRSPQFDSGQLTFNSPTSSWFPQTPGQTPPDNQLQLMSRLNTANASSFASDHTLAFSRPDEQQVNYPIYSSNDPDPLLDYREPSKYLGVQSDLASFPSPVSGYTPSPALTAFTNISEYDGHDSMFPFSEHTSPLMDFHSEPLLFNDNETATNDNGLLFDPSLASVPEEREPALRGQSPVVAAIKKEDTEFSPSSGFAGMNISENATSFPPFTNLFQSDLKRTRDFGFVNDDDDTKKQKMTWEEDDEYSVSDSDEMDDVVVKKEYIDEFEDTSNDEEVGKPAQYGQKSLPIPKREQHGQKTVPSPRKDSKIDHVKKEAMDMSDEEDESDFEEEEQQTSDDDFEMKSDPDSEPEFMPSSDDEFTTQPVSAAARRKSGSGRISKSLSGNFTCPICHRDFNRRFNLLTHLKTHDANRARPFTCPNCAATFVRQHDLTRHASVHALNKPHKCPGCGTEFSRRDAMLRHVMLRGKCSRAAEKAEKEAIEKLKINGGNIELSAAAAGLSRGRGRRRKSDGLSIQKTEIQLLHEDPEAKKVIDEAFRMQRELKKGKK